MKTSLLILLAVLFFPAATHASENEKMMLWKMWTYAKRDGHTEQIFIRVAKFIGEVQCIDAMNALNYVEKNAPKGVPVFTGSVRGLAVKYVCCDATPSVNRK